MKTSTKFNQTNNLLKKVSKIMDAIEQKKLAIINNPEMSEQEKMDVLDALKNDPNAVLVAVPVETSNKETMVQETDPVDYQVLPTNSPEVKEILENPDLSEEEKLKAINDLSELNEAKMKEAFEKRDPVAVRKMMAQMQAMVAGMGFNTPNMFNGFKFPKPPKIKEPNEALQSAAEAKRARKAAKNLAAVQKKALAKV